MHNKETEQETELVLEGVILVDTPSLSLDIYNYIRSHTLGGFPGGSVVKNLPANSGDAGSILGSGRSPEGGNGNPLQCYSLGNPKNRGAWWAAVHGIIK